MATALHHYLPRPPSLFVGIDSFTLRCWKCQLLTSPALSATRTCFFKQPRHSWEHPKGSLLRLFYSPKMFYILLSYQGMEWPPDLVMSAYDTQKYSHCLVTMSGILSTFCTGRVDRWESSVFLFSSLSCWSNLEVLLWPSWQVQYTCSDCWSHKFYWVFCYLYCNTNWILHEHKPGIFMTALQALKLSLGEYQLNSQRLWQNGNEHLQIKYDLCTLTIWP